MSMLEGLAKELEQEAAKTRKFLERLPESRLDWRPHPKSETLGGLAAHLVQCIAWTESIFAGPELDFDPATAKRAPNDSVPGLLASFDETIAGALAALAAASESDLDGTWGLKLRGRPIFAGRRRRLVMRDFVLGHLVHHRGQLSVYLRLLDVPVPGVYGPSADEKS
jgi:uncharacterized damage-inducible protein DinB